MTTTTDTVTTFPPPVGWNSPWRWGVPLFALLALLLLLLTGYNVPLFYWMNGVLSHAPDSVWVHLSLIADGQLVVLFALPFLGRRPDVVWKYILATLLAGIFVYVMKEVFSTLRPPAILPMESFHLIGPDLQNNAFPSGHTTAFFVLAGLLAMHQARAGLKWLLLLLALMVGFSRIASGVHWPQDVLGGALGGWLVAMAALWLAQYWRAGMRLWPQRIFALLITLLSLWNVWTVWHYYDDVYPGTGFMQVLLLVLGLALSLPGQLRLFNLKR